MKPKLIFLVFLILAAITPASAQFGGVVFDPTNYKNALLRYIQLQQQLQQLQQTYNLYLQQYQFIQNQARQLQDMNARYRAQFAQWRQLASADTFGNTALWTNGVNGNTAAISSGYSRIVPAIPNYPMTDFSPELQSTLETQHGTLELQDATNIQSLRTIGEIRGNAQQVEGKWSSLRFEIDTETRQDLMLYSKFSESKPDHVIRGALRLLFKTDPEFGPWREQHKDELTAGPNLEKKPKSSSPGTHAQASGSNSRKSE
jgi:hypothetical protein